MTNVNCIMIPVTNEYGSQYGTEYCFFPQISVSQVEVRDFVKERPYSNLYRNPFAFLVKESKDCLSVGNDIYSQVFSSNVDNIEQAIARYFEGV